MADIQPLPKKAIEKGLTPSASAHLDSIRGLAAIAVLIGHSRNLFFMDWVHVGNKTKFLAFLYSITVFGHQAVMIFFVLSGLLVGSSVLRSIQKERWSASRYLVHRILRLEIVLIPALFLCFFWDMSGIHLFGLDGIYGGHTHASVMGYNIRHAISLPLFIGNAAFLQSWRISVFGSDNPLWSLAYEFWYYLLFPSLVLVFAPRNKLASRIAYGTIFLTIVWIVRIGFLLYFPIWLLGIAIFYLPKPNIPSHVTAGMLAFSAAIFVFDLLLVRIYWRNDIVSDYSVAVSFAFLLYWLLHLPTKVSSIYSKASHGLAASSYTLYVVHMPLLVFISALLGVGKRWAPTPRHLIFLFSLNCGAWIYAYGVSRLFEARTNTVRRWVEQKLGLA